MNTIYGNYTAPAVSFGGVGSWHIESDTPTVALCGKTKNSPFDHVARMLLHVSLLECSRCMKLGREVYEKDDA